MASLGKKIRSKFKYSQQHARYRFCKDGRPITRTVVLGNISSPAASESQDQPNDEDKNKNVSSQGHDSTETIVSDFVLPSNCPEENVPCLEINAVSHCLPQVPADGSVLSSVGADYDCGAKQYQPKHGESHCHCKNVDNELQVFSTDDMVSADLGDGKSMTYSSPEGNNTRSEPNSHINLQPVNEWLDSNSMFSVSKDVDNQCRGVEMAGHKIKDSSLSAVNIPWQATLTEHSSVTDRVPVSSAMGDETALSWPTVACFTYHREHASDASATEHAEPEMIRDEECQNPKLKAERMRCEHMQMNNSPSAATSVVNKDNANSGELCETEKLESGICGGSSTTVQPNLEQCEESQTYSRSDHVIPIGSKAMYRVMEAVDHGMTSVPAAMCQGSDNAVDRAEPVAGKGLTDDFQENVFVVKTLCGNSNRKAIISADDVAADKFIERIREPTASCQNLLSDDVPTIKCDASVADSLFNLKLECTGTDEGLIFPAASHYNHSVDVTPSVSHKLSEITQPVDSKKLLYSSSQFCSTDRALRGICDTQSSDVKSLRNDMSCISGRTTPIIILEDHDSVDGPFFQRTLSDSSDSGIGNLSNSSCTCQGAFLPSEMLNNSEGNVCQADCTVDMVMKSYCADSGKKDEFIDLKILSQSKDETSIDNTQNKTKNDAKQVNTSLDINKCDRASPDETEISGKPDYFQAPSLTIQESLYHGACHTFCAGKKSDKMSVSESSSYGGTVINSGLASRSQSSIKAVEVSLDSTCSKEIDFEVDASTCLGASSFHDEMHPKQQHLNEQCGLDQKDCVPFYNSYSSSPCLPEGMESKESKDEDLEGANISTLQKTSCAISDESSTGDVSVCCYHSKSNIREEQPLDQKPVICSSYCDNPTYIDSCDIDTTCNQNTVRHDKLSCDSRDTEEKCGEIPPPVPKRNYSLYSQKVRSRIADATSLSDGETSSTASTSSATSSSSVSLNSCDDLSNLQVRKSAVPNEYIDNEDFQKVPRIYHASQQILHHQQDEAIAIPSNNAPIPLICDDASLFQIHHEICDMCRSRVQGQRESQARSQLTVRSQTKMQSPTKMKSPIRPVCLSNDNCQKLALPQEWHASASWQGQGRTSRSANPNRCDPSSNLQLNHYPPKFRESDSTSDCSLIPDMPKSHSACADMSRTERYCQNLINPNPIYPRSQKAKSLPQNFTNRTYMYDDFCDAKQTKCRYSRSMCERSDFFDKNQRKPPPIPKRNYRTHNTMINHSVGVSQEEPGRTSVLDGEVCNREHSNEGDFRISGNLHNLESSDWNSKSLLRQQSVDNFNSRVDCGSFMPSEFFDNFTASRDAATERSHYTLEEARMMMGHSPKLSSNVANDSSGCLSACDAFCHGSPDSHCWSTSNEDMRHEQHCISFSQETFTDVSPPTTTAPPVPWRSTSHQFTSRSNEDVHLRVKDTQTSNARQRNQSLHHSMVHMNDFIPPLVPRKSATVDFSNHSFSNEELTQPVQIFLRNSSSADIPWESKDGLEKSLLGNNLSQHFGEHLTPSPPVPKVAAGKCSHQRNKNESTDSSDENHKERLPCLPPREKKKNPLSAFFKPKQKLGNIFNWKSKEGKEKGSPSKPVGRKLPPLPSRQIEVNIYTHTINGIPASQGTVYEKEGHNPSNFIDSLIRLREVGWYWGPLNLEDAEAKLANKKDGSFLVRDSSHDSYILSLSFRSQGKTHHTRIEHCHGTFGFWSQPISHGRMSIIEFIEKAMEFSRNGKFLYFLRPHAPGHPPSPVALLYPISRFEVMQSLQHICRFIILKHVRYDHIDQLPLPLPLKRYLKEKQYFAEKFGHNIFRDSD